MFLHAGNGKNIREKDIIGIFDTDNATLSSAITKKYLSAAEKRGEIEIAGDDVPKSFILYRKRNENGETEGFRICFSVLSTSALAGRTAKK